ncbi:uncharacterized protein LOC117118546 isoform X2 [Anneissia japonica]|uniref:uncharacterized protein LOC117118546 isoform X2 n=1 Tax=Anneissia japonica TaxID=1529436 RepID=UPI0014257B4A|nr:uncharacterized protein LOC117118546 isoform X2 [Anneissia japonica]
MEANTGFTIVDPEQPVTKTVTFMLRKPVRRGKVKSTAITQIVCGSCCLCTGIWLLIQTLNLDRFVNYALITLSACLYIPSGVIGLLAASNNNISTVVSYQTMSLFSCIASALQTVRLFVICVITLFYIDSYIVALFSTLSICIAAGKATHSVQTSTGCCCAENTTQSEPVVMTSNALNSVAPLPQQQRFTVQHGMNAVPPPVQQPNPYPVAPLPQQKAFTVQHGMNAVPPTVQQPNPYPVAPLPQQQRFTVQHGMNAVPPPVQQPNPYPVAPLPPQKAFTVQHGMNAGPHPNRLNTISYFN